MQFFRGLYNWLFSKTPDNYRGGNGVYSKVRGFSLIELSLMTIVVGGMATVAAVNYTSGQKIETHRSAVADLKSVKKALTDYAERNGYYACPADPSLANDSSDYGKGVRGTDGFCDTSGGVEGLDLDDESAIEAIYSDVPTLDFAVGTIPCKTLGLSQDCMLDEKGNKYLYVVSYILTKPNQCTEYLMDSTGDPANPTLVELLHRLKILKFYDASSGDSPLVQYNTATNRYNADLDNEPHFVLGYLNEVGAYNQDGNVIQPIEVGAGNYVNDNAYKAVNHDIHTGRDELFFMPNRPIDTPDGDLGSTKKKSTVFDHIILFGNTDHVDTKICAACRNCDAEYADKILEVDTLAQCTDIFVAGGGSDDCYCEVDGDCDLGADECCNTGTGQCGASYCSSCYGSGNAIQIHYNADLSSADEVVKVYRDSAEQMTLTPATTDGWVYFYDSESNAIGSSYQLIVYDLLGDGFGDGAAEVASIASTNSGRLNVTDRTGASSYVGDNTYRVDNLSTTTSPNITCGWETGFDFNTSCQKEAEYQTPITCTSCTQANEATDCGVNEHCCNGNCFPDTVDCSVCTIDTDCPDGETCNSGTCGVDTSCTSNADCSVSGECCNTGTNTCEVAACTGNPECTTNQHCIDANVSACCNTTTEECTDTCSSTNCTVYRHHEIGGYGGNYTMQLLEGSTVLASKEFDSSDNGTDDTQILSSNRTPYVTYTAIIKDKSGQGFSSNSRFMKFGSDAASTSSDLFAEKYGTNDFSQCTKDFSFDSNCDLVGGDTSMTCPATSWCSDNSVCGDNGTCCNSMTNVCRPENCTDNPYCETDQDCSDAGSSGCCDTSENECTATCSGGSNLAYSCTSGETELIRSNFESDWDGWVDGGDDADRVNNSTYASSGDYSIGLQDDTSTSNMVTSSTYDVTGYETIDFNFHFYAVSMENGERFLVEYNDGSSWNTVATYTANSQFINDDRATAEVTISDSSYAFPSDAQFRITMDASGNGDDVYIDGLAICASGSATSCTDNSDCNYDSTSECCGPTGYCSVDACTDDPYCTTDTHCSDAGEPLCCNTTTNECTATCTALCDLTVYTNLDGNAEDVTWTLKQGSTVIQTKTYTSGDSHGNGYEPQITDLTSGVTYTFEVEDAGGDGFEASAKRVQIATEWDTGTDYALAIKTGTDAFTYCSKDISFDASCVRTDNDYSMSCVSSPPYDCIANGYDGPSSGATAESQCYYDCTLATHAGPDGNYDDDTSSGDGNTFVYSGEVSGAWSSATYCRYDCSLHTETTSYGEIAYTGGGYVTDLDLCTFDCPDMDAGCTGDGVFDEASCSCSTATCNAYVGMQNLSNEGEFTWLLKNSGGGSTIATGTADTDASSETGDSRTITGLTIGNTYTFEVLNPEDDGLSDVGDSWFISVDQESTNATYLMAQKTGTDAFSICSKDITFNSSCEEDVSNTTMTCSVSSYDCLANGYDGPSAGATDENDCYYDCTLYSGSYGNYEDDLSDSDGNTFVYSGELSGAWDASSYCLYTTCPVFVGRSISSSSDDIENFSWTMEDSGSSSVGSETYVSTDSSSGNTELSSRLNVGETYTFTLNNSVPEGLSSTTRYWAASVGSWSGSNATRLMAKKRGTDAFTICTKDITFNSSCEETVADTDMNCTASYFDCVAAGYDAHHSGANDINDCYQSCGTRGYNVSSWNSDISGSACNSARSSTEVTGDLVIMYPETAAGCCQYDCTDNGYDGGTPSGPASTYNAAGCYILDANDDHNLVRDLEHCYGHCLTSTGGDSNNHNAVTGSTAATGCGAGSTASYNWATNNGENSIAYKFPNRAYGASESCGYSCESTDVDSGESTARYTRFYDEGDEIEASLSACNTTPPAATCPFYIHYNMDNDADQYSWDVKEGSTTLDSGSYTSSDDYAVSYETLSVNLTAGTTYRFNLYDSGQDGFDTGVDNFMASPNTNTSSTYAVAQKTGTAIFTSCYKDFTLNNDCTENVSNRTMTCVQTGGGSCTNNSDCITGECCNGSTCSAAACSGNPYCVQDSNCPSPTPGTNGCCDTDTNECTKYCCNDECSTDSDCSFYLGNIQDQEYCVFEEDIVGQTHCKVCTRCMFDWQCDTNYCRDYAIQSQHICD